MIMLLQMFVSTRHHMVNGLMIDAGLNVQQTNLLQLVVTDALQPVTNNTVPTLTIITFNFNLSVISCQ
jgi:hypothetical protein